MDPVHSVDIVEEEMPEVGLVSVMGSVVSLTVMLLLQGATKTDSEEEEGNDDLYKALDLDLER